MYQVAFRTNFGRIRLRSLSDTKVLVYLALLATIRNDDKLPFPSGNSFCLSTG